MFEKTTFDYDKATKSYDYYNAILLDTTREKHFKHVPVPIEAKYVVDGLNGLEKDPKLREFKPKWVGSKGRECPIIVISAPTGSGKSTFVLKELRTIARQIDKEKVNNILFLTNRNIQNLQQKIRAMQITSNQDNDASNQGNDASVQNYSTYFVEDLIRFDNLYITTYQGVLDKLEKYTFEDIGFVVFDEAHFFLSDSTFNSETDLIWTQLLYKFPNAQKIYMSATTKDLVRLIDVIEYAVYKRIRDIADIIYFDLHEKHLMVSDEIDEQLHTHIISEIIEYQFQEDFSNINLHFYDSQEYLEELIVKDAKEDEKKDEKDEGKNKWLIFVGSKEDGNKLKKDFKDKLKGADVKYIDADTRLENQRFISRMARQNKFKCKALICTSVLDCGVNFEDKNLKNIVIDSADEVQLKQMLGRKRRARNETIDLYVKKKSEPDIEDFLDVEKRCCEILKGVYKNAPNFFESYWGGLNLREQRLLRPPVPQHPNRTKIAYCDQVFFNNRKIYYTKLYTEKPKLKEYISFNTFDSYWADYIKPFNQKLYDNGPYIRYAYRQYYIYEPDRFFNGILPYYFSITTGNYEHLLDRFADEGDTAFMREVCEWLGITFSEDMVVDRDFLKKKKSKEKEEVKESIKNCLGEYLDKELDKTEVIEVRDDLRGILQDNNLTGGQGKAEEGKIYLKGDSKNAMGDINKILRYFEIPYILKGRNPSYRFEKEDNQEHDG